LVHSSTASLQSPSTAALSQNSHATIATTGRLFSVAMTSVCTGSYLFFSICDAYAKVTDDGMLYAIIYDWQQT